jgi:alkanesulfonate monooxygenase SsuD/methylene tetrahydromethanopterin reductase-like flavin-dependent oxidoreductase (luciferase family)
MRLSVLDQSPISEGSTGADALRKTIDLARLADELGYHRYWVAEHHGGAMLAGPQPRGPDRPDRVGHRGDPGRQRRRDAPALQPA